MGGNEPPSATASLISPTDIERSCFRLKGREHEPLQVDDIEGLRLTDIRVRQSH